MSKQLEVEEGGVIVEVGGGNVGASELDCDKVSVLVENGLLVGAIIHRNGSLQRI